MQILRKIEKDKNRQKRKSVQRGKTEKYKLKTKKKDKKTKSKENHLISNIQLNSIKILLKNIEYMLSL